jgi:hypothetical protein
MVHRGNPPSVVAPPIVLVLVLSQAVLVLETTFPVVAIDHREPARRCFATPTSPLNRFLGLSSAASLWNCFLIQPPRDPACLSVATRRHAKASDANPRSQCGTNSQSRNATPYVSVQIND